MYDKFYDVVLPQPEIWKDVVGFEGTHSVSNYGRVKSKFRVVPYTNSLGISSSVTVKETILQPDMYKGYQKCTLRCDGNKFRKSVHRLVAQAFHGWHDSDMAVDHINNIKTCNLSWNLQWLTFTENSIKACSVDNSNGRRTLSSLSWFDWRYIQYLYQQGLSYKAIVANLGLDVKRVDSIWEGLSGRKLSSITGFKRGDVKRRGKVNK